MPNRFELAASNCEHVVVQIGAGSRIPRGAPYLVPKLRTAAVRLIEVDAAVLCAESLDSRVLQIVDCGEPRIRADGLLSAVGNHVTALWPACHRSHHPPCNLELRFVRRVSSVQQRIRTREHLVNAVEPSNDLVVRRSPGSHGRRLDARPLDILPRV